MTTEYEVPICGRLDVDRYVVRMADGEKIECVISDALRASRFVPAIGDIVRMVVTGPGRGMIYYKIVPVHAFPLDPFRRRSLIRKGLIRPEGAYDPAAHAPPPLSVPVLQLDRAGHEAARARVAAGGVDSDFDRERYGRP